MCTQSDFFEAACRWPSQPSKKRRVTRGSHQDIRDDVKVVNLDDDDPVAVWAMVQYLYHLEYPTPTDKVEQDLSTTGENVGTSGPGTKEAQQPMVNENAAVNGATWNHTHRHAKIYTLAEKYGVSSLKQFARERFSEILTTVAPCGNWDQFSACAREVYTATPEHDRGLRDHLKRFLGTECDSWIEAEQMQALVEEIPQVAIDMLLHHHYLHHHYYPSKVSAEKPAAA